MPQQPKPTTAMVQKCMDRIRMNSKQNHQPKATSKPPKTSQQPKPNQASKTPSTHKGESPSSTRQVTRPSPPKAITKTPMATSGLLIQYSAKYPNNKTQPQSTTKSTPC